MRLLPVEDDERLVVLLRRALQGTGTPYTVPRCCG
ncbi:MAG: hypothetical protein JWM76_1833 [Pseudonocardiales bacterium]|nr:hypothetical protein [Pseudonocardiales bacterium]